MSPKSAPPTIERLLAALAASQHGVVAARQLVELGFTRDQIRWRVASGRLHRIHAGVYAVGHPALTREGRWMAAVLACGGGALLSHRDAAALWRMADYARGDIEVTVLSGGGRARPGIRVHRTRWLHPDDRSSHCRIPVTSPARTLLDLAAVVAPRHLELAFEEGLRSRLVSPEALGEQVGRNPGRRGTPALRELLGLDPERVARTRSRLEGRFLHFCSEEGIPLPEINALGRRL
jgi:hypothetical protein